MTGSAFVRAASTLYRERLRTTLALIGIIMGTSSLVLLTSLLGGAEDALAAAQQDANETDVLVVRNVDPPSAQLRRTRRHLSRFDARSMAASPAFDKVWIGAEQMRSTSAHFGSRQKRVTVMSAAPQLPSLYRLEVEHGRFLNDLDLEQRRHTCVIGREVALDMFAGENPLGSSLEIDGDVWSIVGVLRDKPMLGSTDATWTWNRKVLVPETSFDATYNPGRRAQRLVFRIEPDPTSPIIGSPLTALRRLVQRGLLRLHHGVANFDVEPRKDGEQVDLILNILRVLLFGATAISLFVSGINVMNVMLVSVSERTVEIGIRRAVGASPRLILRQFLIESLMLTCLGGLIGISLGGGLAYAATLVLRQLLGRWTYHLEPWAMAAGFASSLLVGVVFGLYPALRASRLNIIEALRNE